MKSVICFLMVYFCIPSILMQPDSYKAAVVEYSSKAARTTPEQNFHDNVQEYINYIQQAELQDVQILVFPEDGLTGWAADQREFEGFSTEVPDPMQKIAPCQSSTTYGKFLVDLSCAVQRHKIYVVVNLMEWRYDIHKQQKIYHNTNVAFDRNGVVIARYRKINLFDEPHCEPGPYTLSTFQTDFGVTFGMFIGFDIMFKTPALDLLADPAVTDVVYSVAWFSELPFFHSNSIQHGYAKTHAVNLLAAGLNNPAEGNGGSGIYLADGQAAEIYISGETKSKLIVQNVPKVRSKKDNSNFFQGSSGSPAQSYHLGIGSTLPSTDLFHTIISDTSLYTFKPIDLSQRVISETICSGQSDFCCHFDILVNKHSTLSPNYVYKLAAFYGVERVSSSKTIGMRNCGLVSCLDGSNESCGGRNLHSPTGVIFESISVNGTFNPKDSEYRPCTLKADLTPATDYMYGSHMKRYDEVEVNVITTSPHDSLLTFGIIGRVFINDDLLVGSINGAETNISNMHTVLTLSSLITLYKYFNNLIYYIVY